MKIILVLKDIGYESKNFKMVIPKEEMEYNGEYELLEDVDVEVSVQRINVGYRMRIHGKTKMKFSCSRCLDDFIGEYKFEDENILNKMKDESERLSDVEVETLYLEKDEIDLMPIIKDIFITFIPINPICSPECNGICLHCGSKLSEPHEHTKTLRKLGDILKEVKR